MSDPSWLTDDDVPKKSASSANNSASSPSIPRAPQGPKPAVTPSRKQVQQNNARLEEEGLEFLQREVVDSTPQVVKETKSGVLIVDEDLAPDAKAAGGAPVHFLKRMREAEEKRLARLEKIATTDKDEKLNAAAAKKKALVGARPGSSMGGARPGSSAVYKRLGSASLRSNNGSSNALDQTLNRTLTSPLSDKPLGADGGIIVEAEVDLSIIPALSDDDKADYALSIAQYGEETIRKVRSNRYQHRVEGLKAVKDYIIEKKHLAEDDALMKEVVGANVKGSPTAAAAAPAKNLNGTTGAASSSSAVDTSDDEDEFGVKKERSEAAMALKAKRREERERKAAAAKAKGEQITSSEFKLTISDDADDDVKHLVPMVEVLGIALKDSLFHVIIAACDLLDGVLENYSFFEKRFVDDHLRLTIGSLITRLKDSNARSKDAVVATLLNLSAHASVGPAVIVKLVAKSVPMPAGADSTDAMPAANPRDDWRYTIAKVDLCHSILDAKPRFISSLSDDCLRIATHGLSSANPQARKRAAAFFGLVRGECGAEGIKKYLSTISPATIKMLKQEIGVVGDDNATFGASASTATLTAGKLAAAVSLQDNAASKEEAEDIAAFEADGDDESITDEQTMLMGYLKDQFPEVRSFKLLFSSRWNLRERVILRLFGILEDKALALAMGAAEAGGQSASASGAGIIAAKLTTANVQMAASAAAAAADASTSSAPAKPAPKTVKRFMQKDDDDSDDDDNNAKAKKAADGNELPLAKQKSTASLPSVAGSNSAAADLPSLVTPSQLGAIGGICEKSFTDTVPAVAAAAVKLLRLALAGYRTEHKAPTPPPSTPIDGAKPPRPSTTSSTVTGGANASASSMPDDVPTALKMLIPRLVTLSSANLTADGAAEALTMLANFPFITLNGALMSIIGMEKVELVTKASVKSICARLDCAAHLLATAVNDKNIDLYKVMNFATMAFQHREPKARTSAATLVIEVYKRVGERIQPHLEHIKGAVGDDLRAKMAKITEREKQSGGAVGRVRLAVFGDGAGCGVLNSPTSPTPAPPLAPSPNRKPFRVPSGAPQPAAGGSDDVLLVSSSSAADMAQGKNRIGNLVLS